MKPIAGAIVLLAAALLLIAGIWCEAAHPRSSFVVLHLAALGTAVLGLTLIFKDPGRYDGDA